MAFTDQQTRLLKAKLDAEHVKTRKANGTTLHYIEGWHAIAEANRIFGYDGWDRRTLANNCICTDTRGPLYLAAYMAKVRIYVRAGDALVVREGSGTGEGTGDTPGQAHEIALKSAETDATKRALATFGNVFGLALYDREQMGVRQRVKAVSLGPWVVRSASGVSRGSFATPNTFIEALRQDMSNAQDMEVLFGIWEQNVATVRALNAQGQKVGFASGFAQSLVAHLKRCAVALVKPSRDGNSTHRPKIDKTALAPAEPRRVRSKEHLRFVARQPCVICGRNPSQAHHIRYAQSKGLALKVSDEFTVPLCAIHHSENHATGDERKWWEQHKIDPLPIAASLWRSGRMPVTAQSQGGRDLETPTDQDRRG